MRSFFLSRLTAGSLLFLLSNCSLTASDVEPDLPQGQLNKDNTLTYHADGIPVVAHNYANLGSVFLSFFGDNRSVIGKRYLDSTLVVRGADWQNATPSGSKNHVLTLTLPKFRGPGTYRLQSPATTYQVLAAPQDAQQATSPAFAIVATSPAQAVVTAWNATSRRLQGTFSLTVAMPGRPPVAITDGQFDLLVDQ